MQFIRKGLGLDKRTLKEVVFDRAGFQRQKFRLGMNELLRMYELRYWYVQNSKSELNSEKVERFEEECNQLHYEMNYQRCRGMFNRVLGCTLFGITYIWLFVEKEEMDPWYDMDKGMAKNYGGLEEGAPEGEETD
jgi:hypothetical protein